jgi:ribonuclease III
MEDPLMHPPLDSLEEGLGYHFRNRDLLERALTHPSYCQAGGKGDHNQRLEFLGDAVLGLVLAEELYARLPSKREGVLTRNRSALAKGAHLSALARDLGLAPHLRLSEAEARNAGRQRDSILEDALEATIGAIYLDAGFDTARAVVGRWLGDLQERLGELLGAHNPKGRLQELIQPQHGNGAIVYHVIEESGPDHAKEFEVEVRILGVAHGTGRGSSKKEAEEFAAQAALAQLEGLAGEAD